MRTWAKGSAPAAFLAVGVMTLSSGTALADTSGTGSVGGGNQVNLPITVPIDISGNAVAVVGESSASSQGGSSVQGGSGPGGVQGATSGRGSILGGNQVTAPITAPINACGNAVSLVGRSDAGCKGGATARNAGGGAGGNMTNGNRSVLGGNQVVAPITAPINLCGNAVAVFGEATAGCRGGASVKNGGGRGAGGNRTSGHSSVLGGNQVVAPITAPINICGNSVALLGQAFSGCRGGAKVGGGGGHGYHGNGSRPGPGAGGNHTDGRHSILGGNQVVAPITVPINVCGNAVGNGAASCAGGSTARPGGRGGAGGNRTSGYSSILGGNQVVAPITAPINVCGNAVAVLGDAAAGCLGGASVGGHDGHDGLGGPHGHGHWARSSGEVSSVRSPRLLPESPLVPAALGQRGLVGPSRQSGQAGVPGATTAGDLPKGLPVVGGLQEMPVVGGLQQSVGLPALPALPGNADGAAKPSGPAAGGPLAPVKGVVSGTPVGGAAGDLPVGGTAVHELPVGKVGLMSAEQPVGVTGMNPGSLVALLTGALLAASATLLAGTRRLRSRRT